MVRRDWSTRLCDEADFATTIAGYLREAVEALSVKAKLKNRVAVAMKAIGQIQVQIAEGVTVSVGPGGERPVSSVLEDRLRVALAHLGEIAQAQGRGVALLFDEAHSVYDRDGKRQFPLGALLSALVAIQDDDEHPSPVMLVLCGLPPLTGNIHAVRSNAERLFRAEEIGNLPLESQPPEELSVVRTALAADRAVRIALSLSHGNLSAVHRALQRRSDGAASSEQLAGGDEVDAGVLLGCHDESPVEA